jgi:peptide/nickel transport system permease protein
MSSSLSPKKIPIYIYIFLGILAVVAIFIIAGRWIAPDALSLDLTSGKLPAFSAHHLLGTDKLGRDVFQLTIAGAGNAMIGPIVIAAGSLIIGLLLGAAAGWYGGPLDWVISRYTDITLSLPSLLLAIVAAGIIGGGYWVSVLVMIVLYSPFDIRLIRSAVVAQKGMPYIESTLVLRMSTLRILAKHIFPNIAMLVLVNFFLNIAAALVSMSSLSYLGLGAGPGDADWGRQLSDGRAIMFDNPAAIIAPAVAIIVTAIAINIVGNWYTERKTLG